MAHGEWCLRPGESLHTNEYLRSKNGLFYAVMQSDGNFVIYRGDWWEAQENTSMWNLFSFDPKPKRKIDDRNIKLPGSFFAVMRNDSNFMVYADPVKADNEYLWAMGGHYDANIRYWALMQDDGNFCLKANGDINASEIWYFCTGTTDSLEIKNGIQLTEMVYDFKNAIVKESGGPRQAASNTGINETEVNQSVTLALSYTDTWAKGWKTSTTLKIGARTSIKVGVPLIADGKVELSTELTQGFEWNETTGKSETKTISLPVVVPPGKGVIGQVTWTTSTITVPFRVQGTGTFASGKKAPISINGVYEGIATHDFYTKWIPYTEHEEHSARAMLLAAPRTVLP